MSKKVDKIKSYINRSGVHWRIRGWWSGGTTFCGITYNGKGHKGGEHYWGGKTTILGNIGGSTINHKGVGDGKSTTKGDGDGEVWSGNYNEEKMCNPWQNYTSRERY